MRKTSAYARKRRAHGIKTFNAAEWVNTIQRCAKVLDEMAAQDKRTNYYSVAANAIRALPITQKEGEA